jgi:AcrR family transcriptional regulator
MGKHKTDLARKIRDKTLELLLEKEPEEISTRDIAKACEVTATSLYYYYRDREAIFTEVKLLCIEKMDTFSAARIAKMATSNRRQGKKPDPLGELKAGLEAFRDWAFANPRIAILVMGRLKADTQADSEGLKKYYQGTVLAKDMLDQAVQAGQASSKDTLLDASLCIAGLWGVVETVILNRSTPQYWSQRGGIDFTNKMIDLLLASLMHKNRHR